MNKRLIFFESCMRGHEHIPINDALIKIFSGIYLNYSIVLIGEKKHINILKSLNNNVLKLHSVFNIPYKLFLISIYDIISSLYAFLVLFLVKSDDILVVTNRLPITHIIIKFLNLFFVRKIFFICHGEMEAFTNSKSLGNTKYYFYLNKFAFLIKNKSVNYILLGNQILPNLINLKIKDHLIFIDHPYDYNFNNVNDNFKGNLINLVHVGRGTLSKDSQLIFKLAGILKKEIDNSKISLSISGRVDINLLKYDNGLVKYYKGNDFVSPVEFENSILMAKYVVFFLSKDVYLATPSGSFFDAIKYEKPIIALKGNSFLDDYFKRFGNIGYLCDNINSMKEIILLNINNDEMYKSQVENVKKMKESLKNENIKNNLYKQIDL